MPQTYNSDGSLTGNANSVQTLVNTAVSGDTVTIPLGTFTWTGPLTITGKNIKLLGLGGTPQSGTTMSKIVASSSSVPRLIDWTLEDGSNFTAELGKLHLDGYVSDHKVLLHGVTTVRQVSGQYVSGIRVHECRFTIPYYDLGDVIASGGSTSSGSKTLTFTSAHGLTSSDVKRAIFCSGVDTGTYVSAVPSTTTITMSANPTTPQSGLTVTFAGKIDTAGGTTAQNINHGWIECEDWVEGVVDHCEVNMNTMRYTSVFGLINHNTSPEWSAATPNGNGNYGDYSNFFKPNGNSNVAGTFRALYFEDNIIHAGCGAFTDTGSTTTGGGGRMVSRHNTTLASFAMHGCRESSGRKRGGRLLECYSNIFGILTDNLQARVSNGIVECRDGMLVVYKNALQGQTGTDPNSGAIVNITKASNFSTSSNNNGNVLDGGPDGLNRWDKNRTGTWSANGNTYVPLSTYSHTQSDTGIAGGSSSVSSGIDTSGQGFGDVYGTVTGGSLSGTTITNCTIVKQGGGSIPADYFKDFIIRNTGTNTRLLGKGTDSNISFTRILTHTSGTSGSAGITITLEQSDQPLSSHPPLLYSGTMELRKVQTYMNAPGAGPDTNLMSGSTATCSGGPAFNQPTDSGCWVWGQQKRTGTGSYVPETSLDANKPGGLYGDSTRTFNQVLGTPTSVVPGTGSIIQPLFDAGYPWAVTASDGSSQYRIGADWSKQFVDHGVTVWDTRPSNSFSPEFASFFSDGVGGAQYPHPLISQSVIAKPTITSSLAASSIVGNSFTYTITATNSPTSFDAPAPLPAGFTINTTTGVLSCLAANNVGQPGIYNISIVATNAGGSDTKTLVLTLSGQPVTQRGKGLAKKITIGGRRRL